MGFFALLLPGVAGALATSALLQVRRQSLLAQLLAMILGGFLGVGLSSAILPLVVVFVGAWPTWYPLAEAGFFGLLCGISLVLWIRSPMGEDRPPSPAGNWTLTLLAGGLLFLTATTAAMVVRSDYLQKPHGEWDAIQIWNYHARFLYRHHGQHFQNMLAFDDHHAEYPLFLSSTVARLWIFAGAESPLAPLVVGVVFLIGITITLIASLGLVRSYSAGLLAAMFFLSPGWVPAVAASQYADLPLSFWFLAAVAVWTLAEEQNRRRVALASGLLAGLGAWTKNEGLPFALLAVLLLIGWEVRFRGWRAARGVAIALLLGVIVPVLLNLWWKAQCPNPNDLLAGQQSPLAKLTDPSRWSMLIKLGLSQVGSVFGWSALFIVGGLIALGRAPAENRPFLAAPALALPFLMLIVYGLTYLLTPHDLEWHLRTSARRLAVQLWPLVLLGLFAFSATPEQRIKATPTGLMNKPDYDV